MSFLPLAKLQEPLPFWDLFEALRSADLKLTLDQYHDLQRSIWLGYIATWDDLKEIIALIWVKPSDGDRQRVVFERVFTEYRAGIRDLVSTDLQAPDKLSLDTGGSLPPLPLYPPTRKNRSMESETQPNERGLAGIKTPPANRPPTNNNWKFTLDRLPISSSMAEDSWRNLQQTKRQIELEIDSTQTIDRMNPLGQKC